MAAERIRKKKVTKTEHKRWTNEDKAYLAKNFGLKPVEEMAGKGAFLGGRVGRGKVFISCPHPEKQEQTMDLVQSGMKYLTGVEPTPVYLERTRGALSVRYMTSDKASQMFFSDNSILS